MKYTMIGRIAVVMTAIITVCSAFAGNVCTWKGGDGKFSDASNWLNSQKPQSGNGDTIVFDTTNGDAITVENDIADDFSVAKVSFATKDIAVGNCGKVTFTGKSLKIVSPSAGSQTIVWENGDSTSVANRGPEVVVDVPLTFWNRCGITISQSVTFNRKVTIGGNGCGMFLWWPGNSAVQFKSSIPAITFMDEVYGPSAEIRNEAGKGGSGSTIRYNGKVSVQTFCLNENVQGRCNVRLVYPENAISTLKHRYANLYLDASPTLGAQTAINMYSTSDTTTYIASGADVVCDRVYSSNTTLHPTIRSASASTSGSFTMKASTDAASGVKFNLNLSLIYDPTNSYTYTLADSESTMTGTLEIKGGTFKPTGSTAFSALSEVIVRRGATLDLSESTAATPFAVAKLTVDDGGAVVAPAGGVTFASGTYRGLPLVKNDYSGGWASGGTVTIDTGALEDGVSYWANPTSGDWDVAANWLPEGVPGADGEARIIVQGASGYTVRMTGAETKPAKIVVGNDIAAKATLSVEGEANFTEHTRINVNKGGEIVVPSGGSFIYDMATCTVKHDKLINVTNGCFVVDGGYATFTNTYGVVTLSGAEAEMLVENGGELVLADRNPGANYGILLDGGATLRMTSGCIAAPAWFYSSYLSQKNGVCDFSGGTLKFSSVSNPNQFRFAGDTTFSRSAQWNNSGDVRITVAPNENNRTMTFSAVDNATLTGGDLTVITIGGLGAGRETSFLWGATGSLTTGPAFVGTSKGIGRFCQTNGYVSVGGYGLVVGNSGGVEWSGGSDAADNAVEGSVDVSGGALRVNGQSAVHPTWAGSRTTSAPHGTILGYGGTLNPPASGRPYVGRMTVSGTGCFTNETGHLFVGVAPYGEGSLVVTGGVLRSGISPNSFNGFEERIACAVGVGGGKGEFRIYGGDCAISNNVWIGGADTNAVRIMANGESGTKRTYGYPFDVHGGEGLLEVSGGSVAFGRDLVVGAEGTGVVSVVGSQASQFTVARNMVLSNEAAFVEGGAETAALKFKADAGGITPIAVGGKFVVAPEARLEVDVSDFDIENASQPLQLMSYSSIEGGFDGSRISLTGCPPGKASVRVGTRGISVRKPSGMIITYR